MMEPLAAAPTGAVRNSRLSVRVLLGLAGAIEQTGISRARLFGAAGLDTALLERPEASVPRTDAYRLCEVAMELTRNPALGLRCAERLSVAAFNPLSHLIAHSTTLGQCFESLLKFHRLVCDEPSLRLSLQGRLVTLRHVSLTTESVAAQRFWSELLVTGIVQMIRAVSPRAKLERLSFAYSAPAYHTEYPRVLECKVHFDQPFTGVVFDQSLMDAVSPHQDPDVHSALRAIAERRIRDATQCVPYAVRVRERLVQQGTVNRTDMDRVARSLGLSARSLRRRLTAEGKPYHSVVREALAIIAQQHLCNRQLTIREVAYEMGFADTPAFHRAFKRWTGTTPSAVKAE